MKSEMDLENMFECHEDYFEWLYEKSIDYWFSDDYAEEGVNIDTES